MIRTHLFRMALTLAAFPLLLAANPNAAFGGEPPGPGEALAGPPVVGTMVLEGMPVVFRVISGVSVDFSGMCADSFDNRCNSPCSARISLMNVPAGAAGDRNGDFITDFQDLLPSDLLDRRINTVNARGCINKYDGSDLIIQTVLKLTPMDNDMDGFFESADADIIMLFVVSAP